MQRDKFRLWVTIPFAWRLRLQSKSSLRPWSFFRWCWNKTNTNLAIYILHEQNRDVCLENRKTETFSIKTPPTITSLRSLVCKWCKGSRKFCLMLSSNEYFTSAICLIASPISIRARAKSIRRDKWCSRLGVSLNKHNVVVLMKASYRE